MEDLLRAIEDHQQTVEAFKRALPVLERVIAKLTGTLRQGGRIYVLGNGGSAADAQHIAGELLGRFKRERRPLPVMALTTDTSTLTAVVNDLGADHMFARQVEGLVTERDCLWVLTVSGTSPNVISAVEAARRQRAAVIGFTGRSGGRIVELCDECLRVDHTASDRVQEVHELAYHLVCERVEAACS